MLTIIVDLTRTELSLSYLFTPYLIIPFTNYSITSYLNTGTIRPDLKWVSDRFVPK